MRIASAIFLTAALAASTFGQNNSVPVVDNADLTRLLAPPSTKAPTLLNPGPGVSPTLETAEANRRLDLERRLDKVPYDFGDKGAELRAALRAIMDDVGDPYWINGSDPAMLAPVFLRVEDKPIRVIDLLARRFDLDVRLEDGTWLISPNNSTELLSETYVLKNNPMLVFSGGSSNGGGEGTTMMGSAAGGSTDGAGSGANSSLAVSTSELEERVAAVMSGITTDIATGGISSVGAFSDLGRARVRSAAPGTTAVVEPKVQFDVATSRLYVQATRSQHRAFRAWLREHDIPRKNITVHLRFLLTSVNPKTTFGVSNPLFDENGYSITAGAGSVAEDGSSTGIGSWLIGTNPWSFPTTLLSAPELSLKLSAVTQKSNTVTTENPRSTTISGELVTFFSGQMIPVIQGESTTTGGAATTTNQIEKLKIGTTIDALPVLLGDGETIDMKLRIKVETIDRFIDLNGNPYPVTRPQEYVTHITIPAGYSYVIGGLESSVKGRTETKIPWLGDIPFFGVPFKRITNDSSRSLITMIVTPVIEDPKAPNRATTGAVAYTLPTRPGPARRVFRGTESATPFDVRESLRGFDYEIEELEQLHREGRADASTVLRARKLETELGLMAITLAESRAKGSAAPSLEIDVEDLTHRVRRVKRDLPNTPAL